MTASVPTPLAASKVSSIKRIEFDLVPLAAGVTTQKGGLVSCWSSGFYGPAGQSPQGPASESPPVGRFYGDAGAVNNSAGANGAMSANVQFFRTRNLLLLDQDANNPVPFAARERMASLLDDHTATVYGNTLPNGAPCGDLGIVYGFEPYTATLIANTTGVWIEMAYPASLEDQNNSATIPQTLQYKARMVATAITAYAGSGTGTLTATANGALAAQDGVTPAVGDVICLLDGTTNMTSANDAGFYEITSLGGASAKWSMTRVPWWFTGQIMSPATIVWIGSEGTLYGGSDVKNFSTKGQIVDANPPQLFPGRVTVAVTLVAGFKTITGIPIQSTTRSSIGFQPTNFNGGASTVSYRTGAYASGGAATVAGNAATASVSITALVAAGTISASDVCTGLLEIINF